MTYLKSVCIEAVPQQELEKHNETQTQNTET